MITIRCDAPKEVTGHPTGLLLSFQQIADFYHIVFGDRSGSRLASSAD
jgi:hypothetical protein